MPLSTYFLEYGRYVRQLRRRRRRAYAPTSNTASYDNQEKILFFPMWVWGSPWRPFGPPELRYNEALLGVVYLSLILKIPAAVIPYPNIIGTVIPKITYLITDRCLCALDRMNSWHNAWHNHCCWIVWRFAYLRGENYLLIIQSTSLCQLLAWLPYYFVIPAKLGCTERY